jgi:N-acetylneuraminic acid mutarotase
MKNRVLILLFILPAICLFCAEASAQENYSLPAHVTAVALPSGESAMDKAPAALLGQWSKGPILPTPKCYAEGVYLDGALYVIGGLGGDLRYDMKCYKLDIAAGTWSVEFTLPVQRALAAVQAVNGKIYIIGGYNATNPFSIQAPVLEYDPATSVLTSKANMPTPVFGAGSFVYDDRIWILGGGPAGFNTSCTTIQIYDPAANAWTVSNSMTPYTVWGQGVAAVDNTVLHVGGSRWTNGQGLYGAWAYKGTVVGDEITWAQIADYPDGSIMRYAAGADNSRMYFSSGYNAASQNSGPPSGKTYNYDPVTDQWTMMDPKPTPVYFSSRLVFDGTEKLYIVGGNNTSKTVTAEVEILSTTAEGGPVALIAKPAIDTWLKRGSTKQEEVLLVNNGSGALVWSAAVLESAASWVTLPTPGGTIPMGGSTQIPIGLSTDPGNGTFHATVVVTTNDPDHTSIPVSITIHVQDEDVDTDQNVLLEEGTGNWCGYCPYGADTLKAAIEKYPGRVFGISYHGGNVNEPMQTPSTTFWTDIIKLEGWPQGSINRIVFPGEAAMALSRGVWMRRIDEVLATRRSPITLNVLSKLYSPLSKFTELEVEIFFHRDVAQSVRLNIAQLEDNLNWTQSFYPAGGGSTKLYPYYHNHVLRQMIPSDPGEVLSSGIPVTSQTRMTKPFRFTSVDSTVATSRFVIFAHVSDGTTFGEILQAIEVDLADFTLDAKPLPEEATFALEQNYPNPFNPATTLVYVVPRRSAVTITVADAMGREVARLVDATLDAGRHTTAFNGATLPSGPYFVTMRAGAFSQTRCVTLMK